MPDNASPTTAENSSIVVKELSHRGQGTEIYVSVRLVSLSEGARCSKEAEGVFAPRRTRVATIPKTFTSYPLFFSSLFSLSLSFSCRHSRVKGCSREHKQSRKRKESEDTRPLFLLFFFSSSREKRESLCRRNRVRKA